MPAAAQLRGIAQETSSIAESSSAAPGAIGAAVAGFQVPDRRVQISACDRPAASIERPTAVQSPTAGHETSVASTTGGLPSWGEPVARTGRFQIPKNELANIVTSASGVSPVNVA